MKKILIISSNRLGDSILTSGLINHYKKINKMNSLTFVCGDLPAKIFKHSRNIERLISLKKKKIPLIGFFYGLKFF